MGGDNTIIFILPEPVFETGQASSTKLKSTKKVSLTKSLHKVAHFNLAWVKPFDLLSTVKIAGLIPGINIFPLANTEIESLSLSKILAKKSSVSPAFTYKMVSLNSGG